MDRELGQASDRDLWTIAAEEGRIMVSKDEDFFILATRPADSGRLLWLRMGNCRKQALIAMLAKVWSEVIQAFESGQQIVEAR